MRYARERVLLVVTGRLVDLGFVIVINNSMFIYFTKKVLVYHFVTSSYSHMNITQHCICRRGRPLYLEAFILVLSC